MTLDAGLTAAQCDQNLLITRMLDDLYWVMSYSRWKDERYWPAFRDALMREHPSLNEAGLLKARDFNFHATTIRASAATRPTRLTPAALPISRCCRVRSLPAVTCTGRPTSIDAGIYGFIANICFLPSTRR